jgi:hypothetical protein
VTLRIHAKQRREQSTKETLCEHRVSRAAVLSQAGAADLDE